MAEAMAPSVIVFGIGNRLFLTRCGPRGYLLCRRSFLSSKALVAPWTRMSTRLAVERSVDLVAVASQWLRPRSLASATTAVLINRHLAWKNVTAYHHSFHASWIRSSRCRHFPGHHAKNPRRCFVWSVFFVHPQLRICYTAVVCKDE